MNRGQRITEQLRDPDTEDKFISHWLVLFIIYRNPGTTLESLQKDLEDLWRKINEKDEKIFLNFGGCSDGHNYNLLNIENVLANCAEIGLIKIYKDNCYKDTFYICDSGARELLNGLCGNWPKLKIIGKEVIL